MTEQKKVHIPVKGKRMSDESRREELGSDVEVGPVTGEGEQKRPAGEGAEPGRNRGEAAAGRQQNGAEGVDWQDLALRLQAEMENFRKRQRRLAQDEVVSERERLLRGMLSVADNLERALAESHADSGLRRGVEVTYNGLMQWLCQQGVERLQSRGEPFDPARHEAISTVPRETYGVRPQTVVEVMEEGYTLNGRLLRPAKVVVAV